MPRTYVEHIVGLPIELNLPLLAQFKQKSQNIRRWVLWKEPDYKINVSFFAERDTFDVGSKRSLQCFFDGLLINSPGSNDCLVNNSCLLPSITVKQGR
jgi:hypothetical protein